MQTVTDPNSAGSAVLATSGAGELERLRFVLRHVTAWTQWWTNYEDVNLRNRTLRVHQTVQTATNTKSMLYAETTGSGTGTRFHAVAFGFVNQGVHHETALLRYHVNTTTIAMLLSLGGDLHLGGTLMVGSRGAASHAAIFQGAHTATGLFWPAPGDLAVTLGGARAATFTDAGLVIGATSILSGTGLDIQRAGNNISGSFNAAARLANAAADRGLLVGFDTASSGSAVLAPAGTSTFFQFWTHDGGASAERLRLTAVGNLKLGGTANRATTEGTNKLELFDGTAPAGTLAAGISLYSTLGELRVMDSGGTATLLSPHDRQTGEWIFLSKNTRTGHVLRIDMERLMRALNRQLGGGYLREYYEPEEAWD